MSHVVSSKALVLDLECLKRAVEKCFPNLRWLDKKTYHWYGKWMADFHGEDAAYKNGIDTKDYGKCEAALHMDGVNYEIGICKRADGKGYSLVWDFYSDGKKLSQCVGNSAEKLMAAYQQEFLQQYAEQENLSWSSEDQGEEIVVEMEVQS